MKSLTDIPLPERDRAAVERAAAIARQMLPVSQVVLFGSKARGDDAFESDVDLLILTQGPVTMKDRRRLIEALLDVELELGVVISVVVAPQSEWDHGIYQSIPLHVEVDRDGVAA